MKLRGQKWLGFKKRYAKGEIDAEIELAKIVKGKKNIFCNFLVILFFSSFV